MQFLVLLVLVLIRRLLVYIQPFSSSEVIESRLRSSARLASDYLSTKDFPTPWPVGSRRRMRRLPWKSRPGQNFENSLPPPLEWLPLSSLPPPLLWPMLPEL